MRPQYQHIPREELTDEMIEGDYEIETGNQIFRLFCRENILQRSRNGFASKSWPFTWGKSAEKSVYNAGVSEEIAKMAMFILE